MGFGLLDVEVRVGLGARIPRRTLIVENKHWEISQQREHHDVAEKMAMEGEKNVNHASVPSQHEVLDDPSVRRKWRRTCVFLA